jgi:CRISPR-associated protein (TIGR02584 family)
MSTKRSIKPTKQQTVLLAVTGLSPAIVTETVWALAQEKARVLPRRVVFITTAVGDEKLKQQLFTNLPALGGQTAWEALRAALNAGDDELIAEDTRVIGMLQPLQDIQTQEENDIAASFILEEVRRVVENPDNRLVASIAGGRKTMGALLHAAVTLIGREHDRLTHVLVSAPYETMPGFYFPSQPGTTIKDREGKEHAPSKALVQLADVPFVPLRNRFEDLQNMPGSFSGLVRRFSREIKEDAQRPRLIEIGYRKKCLWVDDQPVSMRVKALAVLHFLLNQQNQNLTPIGQPEAANDMNHWLKNADCIPIGVRPKSVVSDDIRHELNHLRTTMKKTGWEIPKRSLTFPPFTLRLRD